MPVFPSYRNQFIRTAIKLTGFYMRATLALNGIINLHAAGNHLSFTLIRIQRHSFCQDIHKHPKPSSIFNSYKIAEDEVYNRYFA